MCTLGAKKIDGKFIIFKTRDRSDKVSTRIIKETINGIRTILIVDEKGHCEGMNEYGISFVESSLWPYGIKKFRHVSYIGRKILKQKTLDGAIGLIQRNKISSNVIVSDGIRAFIIERTPSQFDARILRVGGVITNHSIRLDHRNLPKTEEGQKASKGRLRRARALIKDISSIKDIEVFLSDKDGKYPIYNKHTISSYIFDPSARKLFLYRKEPLTSKARIYSLD